MKAFVIMPYKEQFETIYRGPIVRAIRESGLKSVIAKDEAFVGPIAEQIHQLIADAAICVADLTKINPNVMYEVGIALTIGKPVVFITQGDLRSIPFDIRHHRVIRYSIDELDALYRDLLTTLRATLEFGDSPTELIRQMLVPSSLGNKDGLFIVAASPLSFREAFRSRGGWKERPLGTYSDHIGIRGLMQSFGTIFGLHRLPELLDPDDFHDDSLAIPSHLYCIASPKANRLTGIIMEQFFAKKIPKWEFKPDPESKDIRNPKLLIRLNNKPYERVNLFGGSMLVWDFGLVIRGPHPADSSYMCLLMAGRSSRGTEASCLAVTDPECVSKLSKVIKDNGMNLDNHRQPFCAVVSVCAENKDARLRPDRSTFKVEDFMQY